MNTAIAVGARWILRRPVVAVISALSLGIGASAAVVAWALLDAGVRKPFGLADANRLVVVWETDPAHSQPLIEVSYLNFLDWQREARTLESLAAFGSQHWPGLARIADATVPLALRGVTHTFFPTLGVAPALGRNFAVGDAEPGAAPPLILSHRLWHDRLGGRHDIVGQHVFIDGTDHVVIGVMPAGFAYPDDPDAWVSVERVLGEAFQKMPVNQQRMIGVLEVLGRRHTAASNDDVQAELTRIIQALQRTHGSASGPITISAAVTPFADLVLGQLGARLWIAVGMSVVAFLLACANVGAVRSAHLRERAAEVAARTFLGASQRRLTRDLSIEALPLIAIGLIVSTVLSYVLVRMLHSATAISESGIELGDFAAAMTGWLVALSLLGFVLTGVLPAHTAARRRVTTLSSQTRTTRRLSRIAAPLLVAQAATAVVVVGVATMAVETFARLSAIEFGFATTGVTFVDIALPGWKYEDAASARQAIERLQSELRAQANVTDVAAVSIRPLRFGEIVDGQPVRRTGDPNVQPDEAVGASRVVVTPEYFAVLQQPIVAGRSFSTGDRAESEAVVIISRTLARTLFGEDDVVGRSIDTFSLSEKWRSRRVVGVAGDARYRGLARPSMEVFVPHTQVATPLGSLVVASRSTLSAAVVRQAVGRVDPEIAIEHLQTTGDVRAAVLGPARLLATIVSLLGAAGLLLLAIGLFGATATALRAAWSEIGVRQAIGAQPWQAARAPLQVLLRAVVLGVIGGVALTPVALAAAGAVGLDGDSPLRPFLVAAMLVVMATAVAVIPGLWRAAKISPAALLRAQ
jgi:predicted permease